jgi:transposase
MLQRPRGNKWHAETCIDPKPIRALYRSGLSTRQIEKRTGVAKSYVHKLCAGITRDHSRAAILRQPFKPSKSKRNCRRQARLIMERKLGRKLKRTEEVHHKDLDWTNNHPSNLKVKNITLHRRYHAKLRWAHVN